MASIQGYRQNLTVSFAISLHAQSRLHFNSYMLMSLGLACFIRHFICQHFHDVIQFHCCLYLDNKCLLKIIIFFTFSFWKKLHRFNAQLKKRSENIWKQSCLLSKRRQQEMLRSLRKRKNETRRFF